MKGNQRNHPSASADRVRALLGHELSNVLHGLLGMAEMALENEADPAQARWLSAIRASGGQLRRLLVRDGLLDDCGPEPLVFDGVDRLEQAVLSHAPAATARGSRLVLIVDPATGRGWRTDPCMLRMILDNLLGNAVKYASGGDIVLEARAQGPGAPASTTLVIDVSDAGPGPPPGLGEELFRPYVRGGPGAHAGVAGRGLGLFLCREVATGLGGEVRCLPSDRGARFRVTLPSVLCPAAQPPIAPSRLLGTLDCRLDLDGAVHRSVAAVLDRWGVARSDGAPGAGRGACPVLLRVEETNPGPGRPGPGLELSDRRGSGWARRLPGPLLESMLVPALLEAAWALKRHGRLGSPCEPCPAGPRGDPDRPPG